MMMRLLLFVPSSVLAVVVVSKSLGVPPHLLAKYSPPPNGARWSCLDGSAFIPWNAVNDDYCDCLDGSDEPGTGACSNTSFYCVNVGHIGAAIPSTRVNDGLCEPECCDGSDESSGVCPNRCPQVGALYRQQVEQDRKLRKTGSKIRSSYIAFAQKEKKRLEALVASTRLEISIHEKDVHRLKDLVDRTEALSAAALEHKKKSPLYASLQSHSALLRSLVSLHDAQLAQTKILEDILDSLRSGYNPNYQDMAVLEAVRGWEQVAGLPHINDVKKDDDSSTEDLPNNEENAEDIDADQIKNDVDRILKTDHIALLVEHDTHMGHASSAAKSLLFDISAYIPESLLPGYESTTSTLLSWLSTLGIFSQSGKESAEAARARQSFSAAEAAFNKVQKEFQDAQQGLRELFDPRIFGKHGEWKKLESTCLKKDIGDYTYEVCLFGEAKQIPNNGGSSHSLGRFASWNPDTSVAAGTPAYYALQMYTQGTKCWNGPQRSVNLHLTCGTENELLSVSEPEKCEYMITGTTPALCVVSKDEEDTGIKEEL